LSELIKYNIGEEINLCVSNHFIEQRAYELCEEIRKNSLYKVARVDVSGGTILDGQWNGKDLITKVIPEDTKGTYYSIKPDPNGLKFAKGELTYKEYSKIQKKANINGFSFFFVVIGFFVIMMFTLMKFLT